MKTGYRLSQWCMIALAFAMVVMLGCVAPVRTAEAVEVYQDQYFSLVKSEFVYGDWNAGWTGLDLVYKDPVSGEEAQPGFTAKIQGEDVVTYLQNNAVAGNSYTVTFVSADDGVIFGDGSITGQITINQRVITESSIAWPRATDITYGQAACDSDLVVDDPKEDNKYGTFIWGEDAICSPGVGNYGFNVDFVLTDTNCRTADGGDTITHKVTLSVKPAELNTLTLSTASVTYQEVDFLKDGMISASSVTATNGDKLKAGEYSLTVKLGDDVVTQVIDAGTYTVVATPKNSNYTGSSTNTFVVNPAVLDRLVLGQNTSVYNGEAVDLVQLAANSDLYAGTLKVTSGNLKLAAYDPVDNSSKTVQDAGSYVIKVKEFTGSSNFTIKTVPSATYTVTKAEVSSIVLDPSTSSSVYTAAPVNADSLKATVYATDGNNKFVMPESAYKLQFQLPPEEVILPRTYAVYVELKDTTNYYKNGDGPSADFEVTKAPVTSFELTTKAITYNGKEVDLANLTAVVKAGNLTLKRGTDYELVYAGSDKIMNANTYAIGIEIINTTCYSDPDKKTDTFTVRPASLNDFNLNDVGSTYDREVVDPDMLDATVKAEVMVDGQKVTLTLNRKDFVLTANKEIMDAGTYSITIDKLKNTNYTLANAGVLPQTYTVDPAPVASFKLTTRSSVYDGNEVNVGDLSATVTAGAFGALTLEAGEFALKYSGTTPIRDADSYVIGFELTSDNFTMTGFNGPVTDTYTVKPAPLFSFSLDVDSSVYDRNTVAPNSLKATVTAGQNGTLTLNRSDFELTCAETIRDAKTYDIGILKLNNANYTLEGTVRDATLPYTVKPAPVESVAVNPGYSCFNQKEVALSSLSATVKTNGLTLNDDEYTLTCDDQILNVGRYTIGLTGLNSNFSNEHGVTGTYEVKAATVTNVELTDTTSIYDQKAVAPEGLNAVVKALAGSEEITLDPADYTLVCDTEIRNAGTYAIGIQLKTGNYVNPNDCKDTYTVMKATLSGVALDQSSSVYDQEAVDPAMLTATVRATCESGEIILPAGAYTLTCAEPIRNAGEYTIGVALVDTDNYAANDSVVARYTVEQAKVSSVVLDETSSIYSQKAVAPASLTATVKAKAGDREITLPVDAYTLVCEESIVDAGTYAIGIVLTDTNYTDPDHCTDTYTVTPTQLQQLTLGVTTLIYDQQDVDLSALKPTVTATTNDGKLMTLPYGGADAAYAVVFNGNGADATVKNAGTYKLEVKLLDTRNYVGEAAADFVVTPAKVKQLTLGVKQSVYDRSAVDLTTLAPTVIAVTNGDAIITLPYGDKDAAYYIDGVEAVQVGDYEFKVKLIDQLNYEADAEITDTYAILRMPVAPLSMEANVTNSDGEYVLGGPVSEGHRTITIKGEPNESVYVVANGAVQSDLLKLNESGVATLTVDGNGTAGRLALGEKAELVLDGSGLGQAFDLTVVYEDAANLRDDQEEAAPAQPQASYRYDMEAVTVEVAQMNNRSAQGVVVSLPEDLAEIAFASRRNAQIPFSGSRSGRVKGDAQVIGFDGNNKLNSTELDGNSVYDVTYTDLVGNTGAVVDQTVNKSSGTLTMDSVDPALNVNKRIGITNKLTWTIICSFSGISYEYELNEGVVLVSEDVRVYTTRSREDSMAHTGVLLTRSEATQVPNKMNQYYVTAEFELEVEANQLTTTFQLESAAESDLKMEYRDRQNNKPLN